MADPTDNPIGRVVGPWQRVIDDMVAIASRYREDGWTAIELHPGDVTVLTGAPRTVAERRGSYEPESHRLGLDVVVPDD